MITLQLTGILYFFEKHYDSYLRANINFTCVERIVTRMFTFETEIEKNNFLASLNTEFYNWVEKKDTEYLDRFEELFGIRNMYSGYKIYVNQVDDPSKPIIIDNDVDFDLPHSPLD